MNLNRFDMIIINNLFPGRDMQARDTLLWNVTDKLENR